MLTESVSFPAAFAAGLLSFFSPCVLPLIPAYFTFITGSSLDPKTLEHGGQSLRIRILAATLAYVAGFSTVFVLMGASASYLGSAIQTHRDLIRIAGGIVIIVFGIHLTGIVRIPGLQLDKRIHTRHKPLHVFGHFVIGMAFGAGWSPCIGPLLGAVLILAGSQSTVWQGMGLLTVYSAGLALPFIGISLFVHLVMDFVRRASRILKYINPAAGSLLIVLGVLLLTNKLFRPIV